MGTPFSLYAPHSRLNQIHGLFFILFGRRIALSLLRISGFCAMIFHGQCLPDVVIRFDTYIIHQIVGIVSYFFAFSL